MPTQPNKDNLHIGKGVVSFKPTGSSAFTDLGECSSFSRAMDVTSKDYFTARSGIKKKLVSRVTGVAASGKLVLNEITGFNLSLFELATYADSSGDINLYSLTDSQKTGTLKVVGSNDVGQQVDWVGAVQFKPSGDFIHLTDGDDYTAINLTFDIEEDADGHYGKSTVRDTA